MKTFLAIILFTVPSFASFVWSEHNCNISDDGKLNLETKTFANSSDNIISQSQHDCEQVSATESVTSFFCSKSEYAYLSVLVTKTTSDEKSKAIVITTYTGNGMTEAEDCRLQ